MIRTLIPFNHELCRCPFLCRTVRAVRDDTWTKRKRKEKRKTTTRYLTNRDKNPDIESLLVELSGLKDFNRTIFCFVINTSQLVENHPVRFRPYSIYRR